MALPKYEFLNELTLQGDPGEDEKDELLARKGEWYIEEESQELETLREADNRIEACADDQREAGLKTTGTLGRVWMVRRSRDAKLFLAQEFHDPERILNVAGESMLRLLNHPNLVSLVDIVHGTQSGFDYTVWEHCSRGTLARPLHDLKGRSVPASVPEDFSWHVLEGIGAALCWLHTGMKVTFPFGRGMRHDPDWHTILHKDIHPSNIFLCHPSVTEQFGQVKLGCFTSTSVCVNPGPQEAPPEFLFGRSLYWPLEIIENKDVWKPSAEIWSLGAVIWHILTGHPPLLEEVKRGDVIYLEHHCNVLSLRGPSREIRDVLSTLLDPLPAQRPTSVELCQKVGRGQDMLRHRLKPGVEERSFERASKQGGMPKIFGDVEEMLGTRRPRSRMGTPITAHSTPRFS